MTEIVPLLPPPHTPPVPQEQFEAAIEDARRKTSEALADVTARPPRTGPSPIRHMMAVDVPAAAEAEGGEAPAAAAGGFSFPAAALASDGAAHGHGHGSSGGASDAAAEDTPSTPKVKPKAVTPLSAAAGAAAGAGRHSGATPPSTAGGSRGGRMLARASGTSCVGLLQRALSL